MGADGAFQTACQTVGGLDHELQFVTQRLSAVDRLLKRFRRLCCGFLHAGDADLGPARRIGEAFDQIVQFRLVVAQAAQPPVQHDGEADRRRQQDDDQDVQDERESDGHRRVSASLVASRSIRTAIWPPLRPIRPSNIETSPQRSSMLSSGVALSRMRVPTFQFSTS
jgi:hypothetical protein